MTPLLSIKTAAQEWGYSRRRFHALLKTHHVQTMVFTERKTRNGGEPPGFVRRADIQRIPKKLG